MDEIKIYKNENFGELRTIIIDGEPYFVGKDVTDVLGYANSRDTLAKHVDDEDKNTVAIRDGIAGNPNQVVINESGLYSLILSSKLPTAKQFKRWVTSEVLPSIRKTGFYATPVTAETILNNPDEFIKILQEYKKEKEKNKELTTQVAIQNQQIAEMKPKVTYYDIVLSCKDPIAISTIAKEDYGRSAKWLNNYLKEKKVQYKLSKKQKTWLLYQEYADKGYTKSKTIVYKDQFEENHSRIHTYWTQKGRLFIYELLKKDGILPLCEQEYPNNIDLGW